MAAAFVALVAVALPATPAGAASVSLVPGSAPPALPPGTEAEGPVASSAPLHLSLSLPSRDPAGLLAAVRAVSTPGSGSYRKFIRPAEFASLFGASPAVIAGVRSELAALGVPAGRVSDNRLEMTVVTTAGRAESAFHTSIRRTRLPDGRQGFANVTRPVYPAGVSAIAGLDDVKRRTHASAPAPLAPSVPIPCATASGFGYSPSQLATAYDLGPLYSRGLSGNGTTIALYELADYTDSDVSAYRSCYGTSTTVNRVLVDGGAPVGTGTLEVTADIEVALSMAPGSSILVYEAPNTAVGNIDNLNQIVAEDRASVISTSWGICEAVVSPGDIQAEANIFSEAALQGQTVLAASGDAGSNAECSTNGPPVQLEVSDPASQPGVTGVGGTDLQSVASPRTEVTWDDTTGIVRGASGGGNSSDWSRPSWQQGAGVTSTYSGVNCSLPGGCREVPDVSASASPTHGYPVYCTGGDCNGGGWGGGGGTSLAAPFWAALIALTDQSCAGGVGLINPVLYEHPQDFFDITSGNTDLNGNHGVYFPATAGYDMATGLGTPRGAQLVAALCPAARQPAGPDASYWTVAADGGIFTFGSAPFLGSTGAIQLNQPIVGMARDPATGGYWLVAADGGVFSFDAAFYGSTGAIRLNQPIVGMSSTPDGHGYWLVAADGGVFSFGDAAFHGSTGGIRLNRPVVGMAADPATGGYWLVAADGGVFSFAAPFYGSTGNLRLDQPIVGVSALGNGTGYRFVAADGGVFDFGSAGFYGSTGGIALNRPVVGLADTPDGAGYWLVASDGGIFSFGDAQFSGSTGNIALNQPMVGAAASS